MGEVVYGIVFGKPKTDGNDLDRLVDDMVHSYPQALKYLQAQEIVQLPSDCEPNQFSTDEYNEPPCA